MGKKQKDYYTHARTDLLNLIPSGVRKILDIGCGEGMLGRQIKEFNRDIEVIGIEKDEGAYKRAIKNVDNVIFGDIEEISLPFEENYFDCIIAGDILEHLVDPWKTIKNVRYFLREDGFFISSMPNIRYYKVLIRLFLGYWDYTNAGVLDKSHLRFFSLINIKEMFQSAGFKIEEIRRNIVSARGFSILNFLLFNKLKEFLTYQYYIIARKNSKLLLQESKREVIKF